MLRNERLDLLIMLCQLKETFNKPRIKLRCPTTKIRLNYLFFKGVATPLHDLPRRPTMLHYLLLIIIINTPNSHFLTPNSLLECFGALYQFYRVLLLARCDLVIDFLNMSYELYILKAQ